MQLNRGRIGGERGADSQAPPRPAASEPGSVGPRKLYFHKAPPVSLRPPVRRRTAPPLRVIRSSCQERWYQRVGGRRECNPRQTAVMVEPWFLSLFKKSNFYIYQYNTRGGFKSHRVPEACHATAILAPVFPHTPASFRKIWIFLCESSPYF